jgi:ubiquinone/menaquinone biosynthesis C-methylase UbiE
MYLGNCETENSLELELPNHVQQIEPGSARVLGKPAEEGEIAKMFDDMAGAFYHMRHDTVGALDIIGYPAIWELLNGHILENSQFLDLASGTGALTHELLQRYGSVTKRGQQLVNLVVNIDISRQMLAIARKKISDRRVVFLESSATQMILPDDMFDAAFCIFGLGYMNIPQALDEVSRVVKPQGRFVALVPHPDRNQEYWEVGGNEGAFPSGWVLENWEDWSHPVKKQYLRKKDWVRFSRTSKLDLRQMIEPTLDEDSTWPANIVKKYRRTRHRMLILDFINEK